MKKYLACILCALSLNSCISTVHQYVWRKAKVTNDARWLEQSNNIELYQVGDTYYAKGYRGQARGCQSGLPFSVLLSHGGPSMTFTPTGKHTEEVYFEQPAYIAREISQALKEQKTEIPVLTISIHTPLTRLPEHAERLSIKGVCPCRIMHTDDYKIGTDAHRYYAYPLGALLAVTVDAPLSILQTATLVTAGALMAPITLPVTLGQQILTDTQEN